jgi:hypothetical protein
VKALAGFCSEPWPGGPNSQRYVGLAPVFPKAIQNEIFLNSDPFVIADQDLDVCYLW